MGLIKKNHFQSAGELLIKENLKLSRSHLLAPLVMEQSEVEEERSTPINLEEAKSESELLLDRARREANELREEAREAGRREGREEVASYIEQALETLNQAVKERKKIIKDSENELLRLSLKIAEQIIRSEVSLHRDVCLNIVSEAIGRVSDREQIIVKVNHDDAEYIKRYKDRLAGILDGVKSFSVIEDASVEAGGCIIETNLGFVDARISTKLRSIEEALQKVSAEEKDSA